MPIPKAGDLLSFQEMISIRQEDQQHLPENRALHATGNWQKTGYLFDVPMKVNTQRLIQNLQKK